MDFGVSSLLNAGLRRLQQIKEVFFNLKGDSSVIAEIGHFALILALVLSVVQCVLPLVGARAASVRGWRLRVPRPTPTRSF